MTNIEQERAHSSGFPIDTAALEDFVKSVLRDVSGPVHVTPVAGGQSNPTYYLTVGDRRLVLRKKPPGKLLPSAHAVDREYRVLDALADTDVPVPKVLTYCDDDAVVGTPFYVMEHVEGRIFSDATLSAAPASDRRAMYRDAARVLAAIHGIDVHAVGLSDYGKPGRYIERQIERWSRQWSLSRAKAIPEIDRLIDWLRENVPRDDHCGLVHGDFRIGNLIFHPAEPRIVTVLDWELSTLGDPLADLAHACIYGWHIRADEYGGLLGEDLAAWRLPAMQDFIVDYAAARGDGRRLEPFHLVLALFRNAVIFAGIAARARDGNSASHNAAEVGALASVFARRGLDMAEEEEARS